MNVFLIASVLLLVIVGAILAVSKELGSGADAAKGLITLIVLCGLSGYLVAIASESL